MRPDSSTLNPLIPASPPVAPAETSDARRMVCARVGAETRLWLAVAVGSLVVAGLLSLAVVIGRLPFLSHLIDDPLFFKRCLVVHVVLSLLVWFYAFFAGLTGLRAGGGESLIGRASIATAILGVAGIMAGGLMRGAEPILANYIPVIDHPVFIAGLATFFIGIVAFFINSLATCRAAPADRTHRGDLPGDAAVGLQATGVAIVLAAATWVATRSGLPAGLDAWTHYEFSAWGAGHVLQVANTCAMLSIWLWLAARATGRPVLTPLAARIAFTVLLAPHFAMPLLTMRGSLNNLYHSGATELMRWGIFPVVLVLLVLIVRHLLANRPDGEPAARMAVAGFAVSAGLTLLGFTLGALIRSSTTLVPAHYHASLGAVTVSLMAAAFLTADRVSLGDRGFSLLRSTWARARRQLQLFGAGQTVFVLGFAIGGFHGLGRKAYAGEQHVRNAGEIAGLGVMGAGGLVAVAAGVWFLVLILSEMRAWWRAPAQPQPVVQHKSQ